MCLECDGFSHEEVMRGLDLAILTHGWAYIPVEDEGSIFVYTIGLVENYGHPELIAVDLDPKYHYSLLKPLVDGIIANGRLPTGRMALEGLRTVEVHPSHFMDFFGTWANRYGHMPSPGQALQVLLPDDAYCDCHAHMVRRLDRPGPLPAAPTHTASRPNRADRRRRGRGHAA